MVQEVLTHKNVVMRRFDLVIRRGKSCQWTFPRLPAKKPVYVHYLLSSQGNFKNLPSSRQIALIAWENKTK